jgi:hypothetical protein
MVPVCEGDEDISYGIRIIAVILTDGVSHNYVAAVGGFKPAYGDACGVGACAALISRRISLTAL